MKPIIPDNNRLNQVPSTTSLNTPDLQPHRKDLGGIQKHTERVQFIRNGLSNAASMRQDPRQRLFYLLDLLSQDKNQSINIDPFLKLLAQITDEELLGSKIEFIVNNIICNQSWDFQLRYNLGLKILEMETDAAKAKDIVLKTIQYPGEASDLIIIELIKKAPEQLQPELYEAFLLNSKFCIIYRLEILTKHPDINKKSNIIECFNRDFDRFLERFISGEQLYPASWRYCEPLWLMIGWILLDFENNKWTQEPGFRAVIEQKIISERDQLRESLNSNSEFMCIIIPYLIKYIDSKDYKQELLKDIAKSLLTLKEIYSFKDALDICHRCSLIEEQAIQEALLAIGMNQVERSENHLYFIFKALNYIEDPQKRDAILKNMFSETARGITFDDLEMFKTLLRKKIQQLTQEECIFILLEVSQSLDAMLGCTSPSNYYTKLATIYSVFKCLYKKIEDPSVRLKSIQNIIFKTKRYLDAGKYRGPYDPYLETKAVNHLDEFVKAFSEVLLDPDTQGDYRPEIKELFNQSGDSFKGHIPPYEYRLLEYYSAVIEKYYDSFPADKASGQVLTDLRYVLSMNILTPYLKENLVRRVLSKIERDLRDIAFNKTGESSSNPL